MLTRRMTPMLARRSMFPFTNMRDEMDRFFNEWMTDFDEAPVRFEEGDFFTPEMDVKENGKELRVTTELPGLTEKNVEVELMKDRLVLKGHKEETKEEEGDTFYRKERKYGAFHREIRLPWEVDADKVKADAKFKNGVLTVTVPRPKEIPAGKKKIAIQAS